MNRRLMVFGIGISLLGAAPVSARAADGPDESEIVVTATRIETAAKRTPVAIAVLKGEDLERNGVLVPASLDTIALNVTIEPTNDYQITIRGVTSQDGSATGDPAAAFVVDNIYVARPGGQALSFFDVDRIEVLKGPQGVLFGRNTPAGVVHVIMKKPELGVFAASGFVRYGNFDSLVLQTMVNVPLGSGSALRLSADWDRRDSYIRPVRGDPQDLNPGRDNKSVRLQLKTRLGANAEFLLRGLYSHVTGSKVTDVRASNFFNLTRSDALGNPAYIGGSRSARALLSLSYPLTPLPPGQVGGVRSTRYPAIDYRNYGIDGELDWNIGLVRISYIGSYFDGKAAENVDFGFGLPPFQPGTFDAGSRQISQELRMATTASGPFSLQAGLYYFHESGNSAVDIFGLPVLPGYSVVKTSIDRTRVNAYAGYAQGVTTLGQRLRLTLGARWSHDTKFGLGHTQIQQIPTFDPATDLRLLNAVKVKLSRASWRAGLDADVGQSGLVYAAIATGFKDGGFNNGCRAGTVTDGQACNSPTPDSLLFYKPETLTGYEIGYKARLFGDRLSFDASLFHYDYRNLQLGQLTIRNGRPQTLTVNAGRVSVTGLEAEGVMTPDEHTRVSLGLSWLDGHYRHYCPRGEQPSGACNPGTPDYRGRSLDRSPKFGLNASIEHDFPIGHNWLTAQVHTRVSSRYVVTDFSTPRQYRMPGFSKTDLSLTYRFVDSHCYLEVLARNLENRITLVSHADAVGNVSPEEPRTYAVMAGISL